MSDNENFRLPVDAAAVGIEVFNHLTSLSPDDRAMVQRLVRFLADRDRSLEDFLNGHVLRKTWELDINYGGGAPGPIVGPAVVLLPTFALQFTKVAAHSSLDIHVIHSGLFDGPAHKNIIVDVRFYDLSGTLLQTSAGVASAECGPGAPLACQISGRRVVNPGTGLDHGVYTGQVAVTVPAAATWTPLQATHLTLTETP